VENLGLDFTTTEDVFGEVRVINLKQGGDNIEVDSANRMEYVQLMLKHLVLNNSREQLGRFLSGFYEVRAKLYRHGVLVLACVVYGESELFREYVRGRECVGVLPTCADGGEYMHALSCYLSVVAWLAGWLGGWLSGVVAGHSRVPPHGV
jgi:hypothetical protein